MPMLADTCNSVLLLARFFFLRRVDTIALK